MLIPSWQISNLFPFLESIYRFPSALKSSRYRIRLQCYSGEFSAHPFRLAMRFAFRIKYQKQTFDSLRINFYYSALFQAREILIWSYQGGRISRDAWDFLHDLWSLSPDAPRLFRFFQSPHARRQLQYSVVGISMHFDWLFVLKLWVFPKSSFFLKLFLEIFRCFWTTCQLRCMDNHAFLLTGES